MKIKVVAIYFEESVNHKEEPYWNGLIIETEDGKKYKMNLCESQCLAAFTEKKQEDSHGN